MLETTRLLLNAHVSSDLHALAAMWADPGVVRHIGGTAGTRQDSWFRLLRYRGLWPLMGFGYWAVREKASGCFIGDVGFAAFERDVTPPIDGLPEAGWVFASAIHGRGYATEALTAALHWLDHKTMHRQAVCLIAPDNRASLRVAARCGFHNCGTATSPSMDPTLLMRRRSTARP